MSTAPAVGRWKVERTDLPQTPWHVWYTGWEAHHPDSRVRGIDGGDHVTWREAFDAAFEGASLTGSVSA